jgi:hypothetical protein
VSLVEFLIILFISLGVLDKSKVQKILKYTSILSSQQGRDVIGDNSINEKWVWLEEE